MTEKNIPRALLTRTEIEWLLGKTKVSKPYQYRIKSDIKKKLKTFTELELPLLFERKIIESPDLSKYTQDLRTNPQIACENISQLRSDLRIQSQNMVGREGFEPSNPAMSRRYLNQARPPALRESSAFTSLFAKTVYGFSLTVHGFSYLA
jgi:hypothetical protein